MKIGILGTGSVGTALAKGFLRSRHEVRFGSRNPKEAKIPTGTEAGGLREVGEWAEVVILAVPYKAVKETIHAVGPALLGGKILVDATNPVTPSSELAVGFSTSAAEELTALLPGARVVKALNTVFAANMATGKIGRESLTLFVAGDDRRAKEIVMRLGRDLGFEPVDAGPLRSARYLEPMAMQLMTLGNSLKVGSSLGLRLLRSPP